MDGKIYINIDFKEYEYFLPRVISCTSYFSHFSPPTFFPLHSQFYSRCFLSPSSATAFRAYLRATHLLEFLSGNFTGTSRLPRSLLFYPSFSLKKKEKKKRKFPLPLFHARLVILLVALLQPPRALFILFSIGRDR